jgi:hypothetical protein
LLVVIGGRSFTDNSPTSLVELGYDLFELMVPDQIEVIASDECLMARVLEYGAENPMMGRPAKWKLEARRPAATDGVANKLNEVRDNWPPAPNTVDSSGISWGLEFLRKHGAEHKARRWDDIYWRNDLERINTYRPPLSWKF